MSNPEAPLIGRCHVCGKLGEGSSRAEWRYGRAKVIFTCHKCQSQQTQAEGEMDVRHKIEKVRQICDRMVADGLELSASEVSRQACGHSNWLHTNATAKRLYQDAIQKIESKGWDAEKRPEPEGEEVKSEKPQGGPVKAVVGWGGMNDEKELFIPHDSIPRPAIAPVVQLEEELHQLKQQLEQKESNLTKLLIVKQQIDEKDQALAELRKELEKATAYANQLEHELNQIKTQPTATTDPYEWILAQRQIWQVEVEQLTADLVAAQKNLSAFKLLAELYETAGVNPPFVMNGHLQESHERPERANDQIPSRNGNNNRGADADQPQAAAPELHRSI